MVSSPKFPGATTLTRAFSRWWCRWRRSAFDLRDRNKRIYPAKISFFAVIRYDDSEVRSLGILMTIFF